MIELMLSVSLLAIVLSGLTHAVPIFQKSLFAERTLREEIAQVDHVIQILTRSVQQAGYVNLELGHGHASRDRRHLKPSTQGIQVFPLAILTTRPAPNVSQAQSYLAGNRQTDALLIQHEPYGHFDCVGRKITAKRTHQGASRIGFFVQFRGNKNHSTGTLMCQSLTNKGQAQNDALLVGVEDFVVRLEKGFVTIQFTMQSTRHYEVSIALHNEGLHDKD